MQIRLRRREPGINFSVEAGSALTLEGEVRYQRLALELDDDPGGPAEGQRGRGRIGVGGLEYKGEESQESDRSECESEHEQPRWDSDTPTGRKNPAGWAGRKLCEVYTEVDEKREMLAGRAAIVKPFPPAPETLPLSFLNDVLGGLAVPGIVVGAGVRRRAAVLGVYLADTVGPERTVAAALVLPWKGRLLLDCRLGLVVARVVRVL